jgi:hypothetical protein
MWFPYSHHLPPPLPSNTHIKAAQGQWQSMRLLPDPQTHTHQAVQVCGPTLASLHEYLWEGTFRPNPKMPRQVNWALTLGLTKRIWRKPYSVYKE